MNKTTVAQQAKIERFLPPSQGVLQRKCACGNHSQSRSCASCSVKDYEKKRIQPRLKIGPANDVFEQEADRMADHVMRIPEPVRKAERDQLAPGMQIQRISNGASSGFVADINLSKSTGRPLSAETRNYMEPRFGADFSHVRLHSDQKAQESASQIQARAFTYGNNIWLGKGGSESDRHLMAHELTHVVQQGAVLQRKPTVDEPKDKKKCALDSARKSGDRYDSGRQTSVPYIQRDFAIQPPNLAAVPDVLTVAQIQEAIQFNRIKLAGAEATLIGTLRDVLGISEAPAVIDEGFVNAVARWQSVNNVSQDGKLGPDTAAPLFRELRAEGLSAESRTLASLVRRGRVRTGPTYTPNGVVAAPSGAGRSVTFTMAAEFEHHPLNGVWASCCEIRQTLEWDAAAATSFTAITGSPVPHGGFPPAHPAGTPIEDRDVANTNYGHRVQAGAGVAGNRYVDATGTLAQRNGTTFEGSDGPGGPAALAGQWIFELSVVDVCNGNRQIGGTDTITINW